MMHVVPPPPDSRVSRGTHNTRQHCVQLLLHHLDSGDAVPPSTPADRIAAAEEEKQVYEALEADARKQNATAKPHLKVV